MMAEFKGFPGFPLPHFTQVPNVFFDELLPDLGNAELRVLLVIVRQTYGWRKLEDAISLSQLEKWTGMTRRSVSEATKQLVARGCIVIEERNGPDGGRLPNVYRLRLCEP